MKAYFGVVILAVLALIGEAASCTIGKFGQSSAQTVDFDSLVANPQQYDNKRISFTAIVRAITGKQAFNRVEVGTDTANVTVTVEAETDMFTFPLDATGADIIVEGEFHVLAASVTDYSVVASGVSMSKKSGSVCVNFPQKARVQNMDTNPDFVGDYMGSGLVTLLPGEEMHLHSTNHSTEIVTVLSGEITFILYPSNEAPLKYKLPEHSAIMVPHSTMHKVANVGSTKATYLYVHAITPVMPAGTL